MKYKIILLQNMNDSLTIAKTITLKEIKDNIVTIKDKSYNIDVEKFTLKNSKYFYYYVNRSTGNVYSFFEFKCLVNPSLLNMVVKQKIVGQICTGIAENDVKFDWKLLIFGILIGGGICALITYIIMNNKYLELLNSIKDINEGDIIISAIKGVLM